MRKNIQPVVQPVEPIVLKGGTAITPFRREQNCTLILDSGRIAAMGNLNNIDPPRNATWIDVDDCYVAPGFIDIHVHGGGGADFSDRDEDAIQTVSHVHAIHGTTSALATLYPQTEEGFFKAIRRIRRHCERGYRDNVVEGIHLEGPFLNPDEPGVLRPEFMWTADVEKFQAIMEHGGPWIRIMTIAPCIPGAMDVLRDAALGCGIDCGDPCTNHLHLSAGHTRATYEQLDEAIDNGLKGITHIYNGMPPMHHREPGVLAGSLLRDELYAEVIADGVHVHPANLRLLVKTKGTDRVVLVTDAIRAACMPEGVYQFIGRDVKVRRNQARLADAPQTLAGSTLTMDEAVRTMVQRAETTLEQAVQMASLNPARVLSWQNRRGVLGVGKDADIVVLNQRLEVMLTIKAGQILYQASEIGPIEGAPFVGEEDILRTAV